MKAVRHPARSKVCAEWRGGLSLVEVLVALAILATLALALFGLQAAGLRYEADLARVVAVAASSCRGEYAAGGCAIITTCLDENPGSADCRLLRTSIELTSSGGRTVTATTVGYVPLEAAPVGVPVEVPVEVPAGAGSP